MAAVYSTMIPVKALPRLQCLLPTLDGAVDSHAAHEMDDNSNQSCEMHLADRGMDSRYEVRLAFFLVETQFPGYQARRNWKLVPISTGRNELLHSRLHQRWDCSGFTVLCHAHIIYAVHMVRLISRAVYVSNHFFVPW